MAQKKAKKATVKKGVKKEQKRPVLGPKTQVGGALSGLVIAAKLPKTVTVLVEHRKTHPLYGKSFKISKRYLVHDEVGVVEGDVVEMVQIRPVSANKHFAVGKVIGRDIETIVTEQLKEEAAEEIAEVMPGAKTEEPSDVSRQTGIKDKKEESPKKRKEKSES